MRFFLLISFAFVASSLFSNEFVFRKITTREGLSQNTVNCILQDQRGFMWFGTNDGLNRYDGYEFEILHNELNRNDGLTSNLVYAIHEENNNKLWISSTDNSISIYNYNTESFENNYTIAPDQLKLLSEEGIFTFLALENDITWWISRNTIFSVKTKGNELMIGHVSFGKFMPNKPFKIECIHKQSKNKFWIKTIDKITCYELQEQNDTVLIEKNTYSLKGQIWSMTNFRDGLLMGGSDGVFYMGPDKEPLRFSRISCTAMLLDKTGNLWVGSKEGLFLLSLDNEGKGLFVLKKHFVQGAKDDDLSCNSITCLFQDKFGILWIGTNGGGVNQLNPSGGKFRHYKKNLESQNIASYKIRTVFEDSRHNIWMGTDGGGLSFLENTGPRNYNTGFKDLKLYDYSTTDFYAITEVRINNVPTVITGTNYYLKNRSFNILEKGEGTINLLPGKLKDLNIAIFSFEKDGKYLWVGSYYNGLFRYSMDDDQIVNFETTDREGDIPTKIIRSIHADSKGRMWVGTDKGLYMLTPSEKNKQKPYFIAFKHDMNNNNSLSYNYILPIFESLKTGIWIGTMGGGLNRYRENSSDFQRITTKNGLPNNVINGILEDDLGNLWISSNRGISKLDPRTLSIRNFDMSDGLQDYEFGELACCKLHTGEMIFGGVDGFNAFFPEEIEVDSTLPSLVFTDLHILNQLVKPGEKLRGRVPLKKSISETSEIKLKYTENTFTLFFTGLHYVAPEKMEYKYKLEGFDHEWINTSSQSRFAKYTSISPGTYTLKVLASNNYGLWEKKPLALKIIITAPLWFSGMAISVYALLLLFLVLFFQKYSIIRIKMKNGLIMERFEKEKISELTQMKFRFFTNISHEFRTPLTLIINYLDKLSGNWKSLPEEKVHENFMIASRNANILLRLINQLLDFRKFEQGKMRLNASQIDLSKFVREIFESFKVLAENKKINYSISLPPHEIILWFDPDMMEKILYNLLSNAFKYTLENGYITIKICETGTNAIIEVADTGIGIPKEKQNRIFERFYQIEKLSSKTTASTGIGLAFSKGLIEMHKGTIELTSNEGMGTSFVLTFPKGQKHFREEEVFSKEQGEVKAEEASTWIETSENLPDLKTEAPNTDENGYNKILIVEDNVEIRNLLKDGLEAQYIVIEAENGISGFEKCISELPDLVISDVMMPLMNGYELCHTIKNNEQTSHIPVILLTAKTSDESQLKGFKMGADAYVIKPFNFDVLKARINAISNSRRKIWDKFNNTLDLQPQDITATPMDKTIIKKTMAIIDENISDPNFSIEHLVSELGITQVTLNRKLKTITGKPINSFIRTMRLKRAAQLLKNTDLNVTEVSYEVGVFDLRYFRDCFKKEFSLTPTEYKKQFHPQKPTTF